jgi:hypothetical protein
MIWNLLAPGPSASQALPDSLTAPLGVISSAYELAPWADFLAATDRAWWQKNPEAFEFAGRKFSMHIVPHIEQIRLVTVNSGC